MIGSYRKYYKCSRSQVLWKTSWVNFIMDLATIPSYDAKNKEGDKQVISPEDEAEEFRKELGL